MNIQLPIVAHGRFKLIKHTGHKFDDAGNVIELGRVLEETPFCDNVFTHYGSAFMVGDGTNTLSLSVSNSAAPPTLDGYGPTPSGAVTRTSTTLVSSSTNRRADPDENGRVWWRSTYRFAFPIVPGGGIVEFRQAAAVVNSSASINTPSGPVSSGPVSIAPLIGPNGEESSVRVNTELEAFDLVWEFTEYVPNEVTGTVVGRTVDGMDVVLASETYTWKVKPANFDNSSDPNQGWLPISGRDFPRTTTATNRVKVGVGEIGFADTQPTFTEFFNPDSVVKGIPVLQVPPVGISVTLGFDSTTTTETIDCAQFMLGHTEWQVSFDPPIQKQARHRLNLVLSLSVVDRDRYFVAARRTEAGS